jgi:hypothetical protein
MCSSSEEEEDIDHIPNLEEHKQEDEALIAAFFQECINVQYTWVSYCDARTYVQP